MVQVGNKKSGKSKTIVREMKLGYCRFPVDKIVFVASFLATGALLSLASSIAILESFAFFSKLEKEISIIVARSLLATISIVILGLIIFLYRKMFQKKVSLTELGDERFELRVGKQSHNYRKSDLKKVRMKYKRSKDGVVKRRTLLLEIKGKKFRLSSKGERDELDVVYTHLDTWKHQEDNLAKDWRGNPQISISFDGDLRVVEYLSYSKMLPKVVAGVFLSVVAIVSLLFLLLLSLVIPRLILDEMYTIPSFIGVGLSFVLCKFYVIVPLKELFNRWFLKEIILIDTGVEAFEMSIAGEWRKFRKKEITEVGMLYQQGNDRSVIKRTMFLKVSDERFRFVSKGTFDGMDIMYSYLDIWKKGISSADEMTAYLKEIDEPEEEWEEWIDERESSDALQLELDKDCLDGKITATMRYSKVPLVKTIVGIFFNIVGIIGFLCFMGGGMWLLFSFMEEPGKIISTLALLALLILYIVIVVTPLEKLFDKIFCRKVTLLDSGKDRFELTINKECYNYRKAEIQHTEMKIERDKHGRVACRILILEMPDRRFHFSFNDQHDKLGDMYECLDSWRRDPKGKYNASDQRSKYLAMLATLLKKETNRRSASGDFES